VLREVSLPMHNSDDLPGYAKFEVKNQLNTQR